MSTNKVNLNKEILALFSGQASVITIPKIYITLTESYHKAQVLNQIIYWHNKSECKDGYFYKSYEDWFEETNIPERTLRRHFKFLENELWISTKVKKVAGKNTIHFKPHLDKIIESISNLLSENIPIRPSDPDSGNGQDTCTEITPAGHEGHSEPAKLSESIYIEADDYLQIKTTTAKTQTQSSSFFSEKQKTQILDFKLPTDLRTEGDFLQECEKHIVDQKNEFSKLQRIKGLKDILQDLKDAGKHFKAKSSSQEKPEKKKEETQAEKHARWLKEREQNGLSTQTNSGRKQCSQPKSAKENFSNLASILGSRPNLSQHAY
jgi:hypothetical protein